jgi:phage-related protein
MPRHVKAWVDGAELAARGPYLIQQVAEEAPALELAEAERPGRPGTILTARRRQSLKVGLDVAIAERFDLMLRTHYAEELARWACPDGAPHILELSSHPQRRLTVFCTAEPAQTEARNYAAPLRVEFTAYDNPYWEDKLETAVTLTGDDETGTLSVPGTVPAPVCLEITAGGSLTECTVTVGGSVIELTGLSLSSGSKLYFIRDERDSLLIRRGSSISALSARTPESADDLFAGPGPVSVAFEADCSCEAVFSVRGRWA